MEILCFFAGIAFYCLKSNDPAGLLLLFLFFRPRLVLIGCFFIGWAWSGAHDAFVAPRGFPAGEVIYQAHVRGVIASIPVERDGGVRFQLEVDELNGTPAQALISLACYDHCPALRAGQSWRMLAKLKKPHNLNNPGGFDYVASLYARHIQWTGYTKRGSFQRIHTLKSTVGLLQIRQYLADMLAHFNPDKRTLGILQALTLGVTHNMDSDTWGLFRRTGTTHLMVISGAHIGLVAGLTYAFLKKAWCLNSRLPRWIPAPRVASLGGFFMALLYALLAGFGVPAQRALVVCFVMLLRHFFNHRFTVWQAWRYALCAVLIYEPHSTTLPGFYLSFLAVAILIGMNERVSITGFKKTLCLQGACLVGLMPLTLFCFSYGSVNGFFANLLAIPWVSFVIIPFGLLVTLVGKWVPMAWIVFLLKHAITYLLTYLAWIDSLSLANVTLMLTSLLSPLALMLAMLIVIFIPLYGLMPAVCLLVLSGFYPAHDRIKPNHARVDVLDVGQGLAVVVRTARHVLVYDTGVKFYRGGDMGTMALIPYLQAEGIQSIDKVVISHPDLDHRGGLQSLNEAYAIGELLVDNPRVYDNAVSCHEYPAWVWDGVVFRFFPINEAFVGKNNRSCVLQVANVAGEVLLTGDIERLAEHYLATTYGRQLASTYLVIPHHGSKTSSTPAFVDLVAPKHALVSYGFDNRYRFPHQQAMAVYQQRDIPVWSTMQCGLIRISLGESASRATCPRQP